jgi:plastocyanin
MRNRFPLTVLLASLVAAAVGCGGGEQAPSNTTPAPQAQQAPPGDLQPDAGGQVIKVEMATDDQGNNKFTPSNIEAKQGDVLRFTLVTGVHNVHFLPDSNPGAKGLPEASALLQIPGQTNDVKLAWGTGRFYFQCDPHALLGMQAHVEVR